MVWKVTEAAQEQEEVEVEVVRSVEDRLPFYWRGRLRRDLEAYDEKSPRPQGARCLCSPILVQRTSDALRQGRRGRYIVPREIDIALSTKSHIGMMSLAGTPHYGRATGTGGLLSTWWGRYCYVRI